MGQARQARMTADLSGRDAFSRFYLRDGQVLSGLEDLAHSLEDMSEETFRHHAGDGNHDFSGWIQDTLDDDALALAVRTCASPQAMRTAILTHLSKNEVPSPSASPDIVCDTASGASGQDGPPPVHVSLSETLSLAMQESPSEVTIDEGNIANKKGITSWWEKWRQAKKIESLAEWEADLSVREAGITKERREMVSLSRVLTAREDHLRRRYAHADEVQILSALMQKKGKTKKGEHPAGEA